MNMRGVYALNAAMLTSTYMDGVILVALIMRNLRMKQMKQKMTWHELYKFLNKSRGKPWFDNTVWTYDRTKGEYYQADLVEFEENDDIIGVDNAMFVEFES